MSLDNVTPGKDAPETFNVIIEIPMNADPIKYEVDKETGAIFVDRFMSTSMHYPTNYGYVPRTLSGDGDPVDVLVSFAAGEKKAHMEMIQSLANALSDTELIDAIRKAETDEELAALFES